MNIRMFLRPARAIRKFYWLITNKAIIMDIDSLTVLQRDAEKYRRFVENAKVENDTPEKKQYFEGKLKNMSPPVFIFGPPRSGSTYLVEAMNMHEKIFITNELRVMSFVNDLFRLFLKSNRMEWNLASSYKNLFLQHFQREMTNVVKRFYLEHMPAPDAVWGDKHPHYSDPALDPGALDTILKVFPDAKFIHIYRNPREQIHSVTTKGWKDFQYSVLAYRRIVTTGQVFGGKVGPDRYLEVKYEDLCDYGVKVANKICNFLEVSPSERWLEFMRQQEIKRTPYSIPVTKENEIGKRKDILFSAEEEAYFEKILGKLSKELGYE